MPTKIKPTRRLRELVHAPRIIRMLGAHDVLGGVLIEQAGFESVFIGGFGTSASMLGLPDINFLGLTEMVEATRRMTQRVSIPVLADADTGHGDLHIVQRCVAEFERAGAAGIILEDQVQPKRCGHFGGKQVIPAEEMLLKWKAALAARSDPEFVFVARTDARETDGLKAAIQRVNRYCEAGADFAFIEAPLSVEELQTICREVPYPRFVNMLAFGKTPILSAQELEQMGFKMMVAPIDSVLVTAQVMRALAQAFQRDGHTRALSEHMVSFEEIKTILGLPHYNALRERLEGGGE
jgi:2-methylisocitrate lyase-like PEP mutase family enzyme